jgi:uncharacterized protein (TIGR02246 family)
MIALIEFMETKGWRGMVKKIAIGLVLVASVSHASSSDDIRNFFSQTTADLNRQDLDAIAEAWSDKGELLSLAGGMFVGKNEIKNFYREAFMGPYKMASFENLIQYIRFDGAHRATVDGVWKIKNGPANYPACGIYVYNLVREKGAWKIAFANASVPREGHTAEHGRTLSWVKACRE